MVFPTSARAPLPLPSLEAEDAEEGLRGGWRLVLINLASLQKSRQRGSAAWTAASSALSL